MSICILAYKDLRLNTRVARQAGSLARAGHAVTVVSFAGPDPSLAAEAPGALFLETGVPPTPAMAKLPLSPAIKAELIALLGQTRCQRFGRCAVALVAGQRFDIVHAHYEKALLAAQAVRRRCGGRLIFDAVEVPFDDELLPPAAAMRALRFAEIKREIALALRADRWVTVNDGIADYASKAFGIARPLVLRNCRDPISEKDDGRLRADLGLGPQERLVLHLNTLKPGEGVEVAVDALARLPETVHFAALGPEGTKGFAAAIRARAEALGVGRRLHLPPLQPPHALLRYAAGADVGLIARQADSLNLRMSLPNRVFEMIAARLPIACSRLPEIARVVRDHAIGTVFEETDPASLAAAVSFILDRQPTFAAAVAEAGRTLNWEKEAVAYVRLVEEVGAARQIGRGCG